MIPGLFIVHPPFLRPVHQFFPAIATEPIVRRRACSSCSLAALAPGQSQMGSVRSGGKRKRNHPCSSESGYLHKTNEREAKAGAFFFLTFFRAPSFVPMWCGDEEWGSHRDGGTRRAWAHAQHWTAVPCPRVGGLHRRSFAAACSAGDSSKLGTTMRDGYPESLLA